MVNCRLNYKGGVAPGCRHCYGGHNKTGMNGKKNVASCRRLVTIIGNYHYTYLNDTFLVAIETS